MGQDTVVLVGEALRASVGGVVGSPQPQATTLMVPSVKMSFSHFRPEPGDGSCTIGDEFTGTAVKRVNWSPAARLLLPENFTVNVPPRSTTPVALTASLARVAPLL